MAIETERLLLREYTHEDFPALFEIFSDPETMRHYPKPFDENRTKDWIDTEYDSLYSYMKYTNIGSYSTAIAIGMKKIKEYPDEKNDISYAYAITRKEWSVLER